MEAVSTGETDRQTDRDRDRDRQTDRQTETEREAHRALTEVVCFAEKRATLLRLQKTVHYLYIPVADCVDEGGVAVQVGEVHVTAVLQTQQHDVEAVRDAGVHQQRPAGGVLHVGVPRARLQLSLIHI